MIISKDQRIVLMGPTKTGTRTSKSVLLPYGIFLEEHVDYVRIIYNCIQKVPNFDFLKIEKYYVFWRDPVERFISGCNHFRSPAYIKFLIRFNPQWFTGIDLSPYSNGLPFTPTTPTESKSILDPLSEIPQSVINSCLEFAPQITPEQIFNDNQLMTNNTVMQRQQRWHNNIPTDKLFVLEFSNFEENFRKVAVEFGAPSNIEIPKLNESNKITTSISSELEASIREYYAEDYSLKP
jgi:hypothetical protein